MLLIITVSTTNHIKTNTNNNDTFKISNKTFMKNDENNNNNNLNYLSKTKSNVGSNIFDAMNMLVFLFITLLIIGIGFLIYFQKEVFVYLKNAICGENNKKMDNIQLQIQEKNKQNDELLQKLNKMEQDINNINNKSSEPSQNNSSNNEYSSYDNSQQVVNDGFCYVGYENGQRECVAVKPGDICMSGEIFPRLDKCMVPELRI